MLRKASITDILNYITIYHVKLFLDLLKENPAWIEKKKEEKERTAHVGTAALGCSVKRSSTRSHHEAQKPNPAKIQPPS
jgi:hypothetical protein